MIATDATYSDLTTKSYGFRNIVRTFGQQHRWLNGLLTAMLLFLLLYCSIFKAIRALANLQPLKILEYNSINMFWLLLLLW